MLKTFDYNKMPIVEAVNEIMVDAAKRGASDIHFDPLENIMKIRIRIDGTLIDYALVPNDIKKNLITRIKIIAGMNITESRLPQDGAIKATVQGTNLDLRVSTIPTNMGEKIVIRILDYSLSGAGIENLGFSEKNYKKVIEMINQPNGIILVTGATGTGKSTTVYAVLQRLNKESTNIITVEDPVEMNIEGVNQIQANSEIGLDFATALRSILRQDPNIIMIGEIRDTETAKIAIRASITGHLVLSTLHTNDSLNTIERLLDMDVERYLLASSLSGIISQRLARKLCPHCRIERDANKYEEKLFEASLGHTVKKLYSANKAGCEHCHGGFAGRIAIQEVLLINQEIRDAISANKSKEELRDLVYGSDVDSLLQDGLSKVEQGITSMEELLKLIELENENATIARMGMEAAAELGDELEEQIIEDEIKATPANHIEVDESVLEDNTNIDDLLNDITEDKEEKSEEIPLETKEESEDINFDNLFTDNNDNLFDEVTDNNEEVVENNNENLFDETTDNKTDDISIDDLLNDVNENANNVENINLDNNDINFDNLDLDNNLLNSDITPVEDIKEENSIDDILSDIANNVEAAKEVKEEEPKEEEEDNKFGFFGKKKKNKKDKKKKDESKEEEVEAPTPIDHEISDLSLDKLNDLDFNDIKLDDTQNFNNDSFNSNLDELKLDDSNNLNLDDLKLDDSNNLSFENLNLDNNNDLSFDELNLNNDSNNEITFENNYKPDNNFDINDLDLDELKGIDSKEEPTIELNNVNFDSLDDDIKETGKLDDDLSGASDDDIMNLFN